MPPLVLILQDFPGHMGCKHSVSVLMELHDSYLNERRVTSERNNARDYGNPRIHERDQQQQQQSRSSNYEVDMQRAIHMSLATSNNNDTTNFSSLLHNSTLLEKDLDMLRVYDHKTPPQPSQKKSPESAKTSSPIGGGRNASPSFSPTALFGLLQRKVPKTGLTSDVVALGHCGKKKTKADDGVVRKVKRSGSEDTVCLDVDNEKDVDENDTSEAVSQCSSEMEPEEVRFYYIRQPQSPPLFNRLMQALTPTTHPA